MSQDTIFYTVKEAAAKLKVSIDTIYAAIANGELNCVRLGGKRGRIRITQEQLDQYVEFSSRPKIELRPEVAAILGYH